MKKNKIIFFIFSVFISLCLLLNVNVYKNIFSKIATEGLGNIDFSETVNSEFRNSFINKNLFIDFKGLSLNILNKKIVDNFEFLKDKNGLMHNFENITGEEEFVQSVIDINKLCISNDIPLIYVQAPARETDKTAFIGEYQPTNSIEVINYIKDALIKNNIDYITVDNKQTQSSEVYFKSDAHMKTDVELNLLKDTVYTLRDKYNIKFNNEDYFLDKNNYNIDSREFLGNFSRSSGSIYTKPEQFEMYIPKFDTKFRTFDENNNLMKEGSFTDVIMNGYHSQNDTNKYTYWVTNYGHFEKSNYKYDNLFVNDGPNVLVICDSQALRFVSYLSLMCDSVTIQDPRFGNRGSVLSNLLENNEYDAIIIMQNYTLTGSKLLYDYDLDASILNSNIDNNIEFEVKNTGTSNWTKKDGICLGVWSYGQDTGYRFEIPDDVSVKPNETIKFTSENFPIPIDQYETLTIQMLQEGIGVFGDCRPVNRNFIYNANAEIVSHDTPDIVNHKDSYTIHITVKNTSSSVWTEKDQVRLCIWQDNADHGYRIYIPENISIKPGEEYTFTLENFVMPEANETTLEFQMLQEGIQYFGEREKVYITAE